MASAAALSSHRPESVRQPDRPHEATTVHTRILRCMLAVDDSHAYWQRLDRVLPHGERARCAFEQRWFGTKSEARIRTLMTDMVERLWPPTHRQEAHASQSACQSTKEKKAHGCSHPDC